MKITSIIAATLLGSMTVSAVPVESRQVTLIGTVNSILSTLRGTIASDLVAINATTTSSSGNIRAITSALTTNLPLLTTGLRTAATSLSANTHASGLAILGAGGALTQAQIDQLRATVDAARAIVADVQVSVDAGVTGLGGNVSDAVRQEVRALNDAVAAFAAPVTALAKKTAQAGAQAKVNVSGLDAAQARLDALVAGFLASIG